MFETEYLNWTTKVHQNIPVNAPGSMHVFVSALIGRVKPCPPLRLGVRVTNSACRGVLSLSPRGGLGVLVFGCCGGGSGDSVRFGQLRCSAR